MSSSLAAHQASPPSLHRAAPRPPPPPAAAAASLGRRLSLGSGEVTLDCLESVDDGGECSSCCAASQKLASGTGGCLLLGSMASVHWAAAPACAASGCRCACMCRLRLPTGQPHSVPQAPLLLWRHTQQSFWASSSRRAAAAAAATVFAAAAAAAATAPAAATAASALVWHLHSMHPHRLCLPSRAVAVLPQPRAPLASQHPQRLTPTAPARCCSPDAAAGLWGGARAGGGAAAGRQPGASGGCCGALPALLRHRRCPALHASPALRAALRRALDVQPGPPAHLPMCACVPRGGEAMQAAMPSSHGSLPPVPLPQGR